MNKKYEPLFEPYTLNNGVEIKNRLTVAPLTIYDSGEDGELTDNARRFWKDRFRGFGLFIVPFTNVQNSGVGFESPNAITGKDLPTLKEYARISHEQGAKAVIQLSHSGIRADREMTKGENIVAPTSNYYMGAHEMTDSEVRETIQAFANATKMAIEAGLDGVEIHGANGWLIQQFVSATYNHRSDHWGGTMEKRFNFPLEIIDAVDAVRQKMNRPDFIVGYRFSPEEPGDDGLTMKETLALIDRLMEKPLQYLHVSLWGFYHKVRRGPGADKDLTRMQVLHEHINGRLPLIGVGKLYTADEMIEAYKTGWAEFIALGKTVMLNPNLIDLIKSGRESEIQTKFDWAKADFYRYTPAMLYGTLQGMDFYPLAKQK
ncbi:NADH-dependent flavin oxidoreductase [Companilactobacillus paralimentarius]|uniref:NADH-dependent flavin oxidoreductase n=1 Tax=Companilactobacillus paralimentarius TaxID=83526 RepID=UPI00384D9838